MAVPDHSDELLDLPAIVAVRRVTIALADRASARWSEARSGKADADTLHRCRVATRALDSWLTAHDDTLRVSKKTRRRLRAGIRTTGALRDADVYGDLLTDVGVDAAEVRSELDAQHAPSHRGRRLRDTEADVQRALLSVAKVASHVRWEQSVDDPWVFPTFADDLVPRLRVATAALRARLAVIGHRDAQSAQHHARIAAKRLRYQLEAIEDLLPEARTARIELKALQDALGDLNDIHLAIERTQRTAIVDALEVRRGDLYDQLHDRWLTDGGAAIERTVADVVHALSARANAGLEIERKLLLCARPDVPTESVVSVRELDQGYLPGSQITERVRRVADGEHVEHFRTIKTGSGLVRTEVEEPIGAELFAGLWELTAGRRVHKTRTVVRDESGLHWEIDEFLDRDLFLAEIELPTADTTVAPPDWLQSVIERDVTDDAAYTNARLAR